MFQVTLYNLKKKPNSTVRPPLNATIIATKNYQCLAKDDTSIITPVILIKDSIVSLSAFNYAVISEWRRYYFIDDIVMLANGLCELHLRIDVLATYKSQIEASTQYILRADSKFDGSVIDNYYPTKTETDFDYSPLEIEYNGNTFDCYDHISSTYITNYFKRTISQGEFVIGVIGENETGITYYVLNYSNFKTLLQNIMAFTPSNMSDVSTGIAKVLADPMQYITSCFWVPYAGQVSQTARTIKFGYYSVSCTAGVLNASDYAHFMTYADIPKHPQDSRGDYLNVAPFTTLTLLFDPFGSLQLDTTKLTGAEEIRIEWYYDCTKGNAEIFVFNNTTGETAYHGYCDMMGVPVQLTQMTVNSLQTGSAIIDTLGSAFRFDLGGVFKSVGNAIESQQPKVSKHGSEGSFLNYRTVEPRLIADFILVVDEDRVHVGRPLCQKETLSTLSGFVQCGNAVLELSGALAEETDMAVNLLNTGVFIE